MLFLIKIIIQTNKEKDDLAKKLLKESKESLKYMKDAREEQKFWGDTLMELLGRLDKEPHLTFGCQEKIQDIHQKISKHLEENE